MVIFNFLIKQLKILKLSYRKYENYLENYFVKNKKQNFINNLLNSSLVAKYHRTNYSRENYNGFIKE